VRELADARARHDAKMEPMRAYFEAEVAVFRRELTEAHATEVAALRSELAERAINTFMGYQRGESDAIN
jgi:hypothetical protein